MPLFGTLTAGTETMGTAARGLKNGPDDVLKVDAEEDGVGGDDAADALRYLVARKSRTVTQRKLRAL